MTRYTRHFVIASLFVLTAGLGAGLLAYVYGVPTSAFMAASGSDDLRLLPSTATVVAYADVHHVMTSELRQRLRAAMPFTGDGQRDFQADTGINVETDIDHVVFGLMPPAPGDRAPAAGLVLARGRFDAVRIDAFLREKGATSESYKGRTIYGRPRQDSALAFVEPGLVAVGAPVHVKRAIDLQNGGDSVVANDAIMSRVRGLESGNVWAVGRLDALTSQANLAQGVMGQLPAITWFSASGQVDAGVRGVLKAEARDQESANGLRDLIRGLVALARMQSGARPEAQALSQALQIGGSEQTVTVSLDLTPQTLDLLTESLNRLPRPSRPAR